MPVTYATLMTTEKTQAKIGLGVSTDAEAIRAARDATRDALFKLAGCKPGLALVFSAFESGAANALKAIAALLEDTPIIGCNSAAILTNKGISTSGAAVMLFAFPEGVYCNIAAARDIDQNLTHSSGGELGDKLLYGFHNIPRDFSLFFSDTSLATGSMLLEGLQDKLGSSFPLAGACAAQELHLPKTYVYYNQEAIWNACAGVLWGGKLSYGFGSQHGWKPLGKPRTVTSATGNIVHEIDATPAVEVYKDYFAVDTQHLKKDLRRISIFYPIGIHLAGEQEYLLRNLLSVLEDGSLVFQGSVPQASQIRLMIGTKESCLEATRLAAADAKRGLYSSILKPRGTQGVLIFDSISRYLLLGRQAHREIELLREEFGPDVPLAGFYSQGEQAPLHAFGYHGKTYFLNQTITAVAIGM